LRRRNQINSARTPKNTIDQLFAVEHDVKRYLQNRSRWIEQVSWDEFQQLACEYKMFTPTASTNCRQNLGHSILKHF
jgi:hypothetical protein